MKMALRIRVYQDEKKSLAGNFPRKGMKLEREGKEMFNSPIISGAQNKLFVEQSGTLEKYAIT